MKNLCLFLMLGGLFLTACQTIPTHSNPSPDNELATQQNLSQNTLIVFYDTAKKHEVLTLLQKLNAKIIYDYKTMNGFAIEFNPSQFDHIKHTLQQHPSILGVNDNHSLQLH